jgi:hypothetical protein
MPAQAFLFAHAFAGRFGFISGKKGKKHDAAKVATS